jgi:glucose/arabinose dehydrogenase
MIFGLLSPFSPMEKDEATLMRYFSQNLVGFVILSAVILGGCFEKSTATDQTADTNYRLQRVFQDLEFFQPVALLPVPNETNQFWVVEKQGRVFGVVGQQGKYTKELVVDISDRVNSNPNEAGLLGLAFHPQYNKNNQVFLSYTAAGPQLTSTISRFLAADGRIDADSEQVLLQVDQPYGNHNGGQIAFGPDGFLYIGLGDGGSAGDPKDNGQNPQTLLGAILRIDVDLLEDKGKPYAIPKDNPFASSSADRRGEIYAWGMRNPWRWSFDRKTGELWVGDVGQNEWEEINLVRQSGNYGWNLKEGTHCYAVRNCDNADLKTRLIDPVAEYSHDQGCSVTGGYVYRGEQITSLQGTYVFGDFCSGRIWGLSLSGEPGKSSGSFEKKLLVKSDLMIASFAEDNQGEIYVIHYDGEIYKIVPAEK